MLLDSLIPRPLSTDQQGEGVTLLHNLLMQIHLERREARAVGWRGFLPSCAETFAWTAKVANSDWVFGLAYAGEEADESGLAASFEVFAFPQKDNVETLPSDFQMFAARPDYTEKVRELAKHVPEMRLFRMGELTVAAKLDKSGFTIALQTENQIFASSDRSLRPVRILLPLYACLVRSAAYVLKKEGCTQWFKDAGSPYLETDFGNPVFEEDGSRKKVLKQVPLAYQPDEIDSNRKPIIHVLCGFLGAGKTTFLQNWLNFLHTRERFTGVIQNEFGEVDLDAAVLGNETRVEGLNDGCICCSLADSLRPGVLRLIETTPADQIILETTGLANPDNILRSLDELKDIVNPGLVVSVVDAVNLTEHPEYLDDELRLSQIQRADVLICSKVEVCAHEKVCALEQQLHALNPEAMLLFAENGSTNFAALDSFFNHWLDKKYGAFTSHKRDPDHFSLLLNNHGSRMKPQKGSIYETFVLNVAEAVSLDEVGALIASCGEHIYRAKGVIEIAEKGRCNVQFTDGVLTVSAADDSFPIRDNVLTIIGKGLKSPDATTEIRRVRCL